MGSLFGGAQTVPQTQATNQNINQQQQQDYSTALANIMNQQQQQDYWQNQQQAQNTSQTTGWNQQQQNITNQIYNQQQQQQTEQAFQNAINQLMSGTTTTTANPLAMALGANVLGGAQAIGASQLFPGLNIANLTPDQMAALGQIVPSGMGLQGLIPQGAQYLGAGANMVGTAGAPISAQDVEAFYTPMAENVTAKLQDIFGQQALNNRVGTVAQTGGVGAERAAVGESLLAGQQAEAAGGIYADLYQRALAAAQQQKAQQLGAGAQLAGLGPTSIGTGLTGLQAALGAATIPQTQQQNVLSALYQQALGQYQDPFLRLQAQAGVLPALTGLGMTAEQQQALTGTQTGTSTGTTTGTTTGNVYGTQFGSAGGAGQTYGLGYNTGQLLGGGLNTLTGTNIGTQTGTGTSSLFGAQSGIGNQATTFPAQPILPQIAGLGLAGAGLKGAFSDRRAKTDISKLGKDKSTGLPLYAYRYKGDPKTYPKVVGPMAQDVAKKYPGAVKKLQSGGSLAIAPDWLYAASNGFSGTEEDKDESGRQYGSGTVSGTSYGTYSGSRSGKEDESKAAQERKKRVDTVNKVIGVANQVQSLMNPKGPNIPEMKQMYWPWQKMQGGGGVRHQAMEPTWESIENYKPSQAVASYDPSGYSGYANYGWFNPDMYVHDANYWYLRRPAAEQPAQQPTGQQPIGQPAQQPTQQQPVQQPLPTPVQQPIGVQTGWEKMPGFVNQPANTWKPPSKGTYPQALNPQGYQKATKIPGQSGYQPFQFGGGVDEEEYNPFLKRIRLPFAKELENPYIATQLFRRTQAENPEYPRHFMESVLNRASARGQSLERAVNDRDYYPAASIAGRDPGSNVGGFADALADVMRGSNATGFATGNASQNVGFGYGRGAGDPYTVRTGNDERYGEERQDKGWFERQLAQDPVGRGYHRPGGLPEELLPEEDTAPTRAAYGEGSADTLAGGTKRKPEDKASWAENPLLMAGLGILAASGERDARGLPTSPLGAIGRGGMYGMQQYQSILERARKEQAEKRKEASEERRFNLAETKEDARQRRFEEAQAATQSRFDKMAEERKAKETTMLFDEKAVNTMAEQALTGDKSVFQNLSRRPQYIAAVRNRMNELAEERNMRGEDIAAANANFASQTAAARVSAQREANIQTAVNEAKGTFPLVIDASKNLPRTDIVPVNRLIQMYREGTSTPEQGRLAVALQGAITAYSQAMSRTGVNSVHAQERAEGILYGATGHDDLVARIGQMNREMDIALKAPEQTREAILEKIRNKKISEPLDIEGKSKSEKTPSVGTRKQFMSKSGKPVWGVWDGTNWVPE